MKLHSLDIVGIGPFLNHQKVDFDRLTRNGLFLIDGPTGAGKSTLIDAITFALYGETAGKESSGSRIRSQWSTPEDESKVELEFSIGTRRFRITRTPEYMRAAKRGDKTVKQSETQLLVELSADGTDLRSWRDAREIGREIIDVIGLNRDQFAQLVVLPQGEFDTMLRAKPTDREKILKPLMRLDDFDSIQERLEKDGKVAEQQVTAAIVESNAAIENLKGALSHHLEEADRESLDTTDRDEKIAVAEVIIQRLVGEEEAEAALATEHEKTLADVVSNLTAMTTACELIDSVDRARTGLATAINTLTSRDASLADQPLLALQTRTAELGVRIGELKVHVDWEANAQSRSADRAGLTATIEATKSRINDLEKSAASLPTRIAELEESIKANELASHGTSVARDNLAAAQQVLSLLTDLDTAKQALETAQDSVGQAQAKEQESLAAFNEAERYSLELLRKQLSGSSARLAMELVDGQPCTVCGSTDHPQPAQGDGAIPDDKAIASAEKSVATARKTWEVAKAHADDSSRVAAEAKQAHDVLIGQIGGQSHTDIDEKITQHQQQLDACLAAKEFADKGRLELERVRQDADTQQEQISGLKLALTEYSTKLATKEDDERRGLEALHAAVGSDETAATAVSQLTSLQSLIDSAINAHHVFDTARATLPAHLADADSSVLQNGRDALAQQRDEQRTIAQHHRERQTTIKATIANARDLLVKAHEAQNQAAEIADMNRTRIQLSQLVTGAGANRKKLQLASYARQQKFGEVLAAATMHLKRMSSGHYEFELNDDKSGNNRTGLGISILDTWTGKSREPSSLSGGEMFYASLSLALGLADTVLAESGGMDLGLLFVDEGFGSLDQESLQMVLDQLDTLRSNGRTVGVISHVTEMKEWANDRITVVKLADQTSTVRASDD